MRRKLRDWLKQLGPGLITGAADDDPSGIATYSQAGAQFGFLTLWTVVFTYPLMVGIQMVSARIGRVTGHGLAANIGRSFPRPVLYGIVAVLVAVFGTTLSPYLFFWQASQEVEDLNADPAAGALAHAPDDAAKHLRRIKIDTYLGMGFSNIVAFCIIL